VAIIDLTAKITKVSKRPPADAGRTAGLVHMKVMRGK
jgi:hypothetical protein